MNRVIRSRMPGALLIFAVLTACAPPPSYDIIVRGGAIYDGSGGEHFVADRPGGR